MTNSKGVRSKVVDTIIKEIVAIIKIIATVVIIVIIHYDGNT